METRYSTSTGTFYPFDFDYGTSLPADVITVSQADHDAAMSRPVGYTFDFVDGQLVITAPPAPQLNALKAAKKDDINAWRLAANQTAFPYAGKMIACDPLSRSDIDGEANHIALFGDFSDGFPLQWKAMDNSYVPIPDVATFKALYAAMTTQGNANFEHAQQLKAALQAATNADAVAAISW